MPPLVKPVKYLPEDTFATLLEWAVIPTFDLVIEYGDKGVVIVRRKIAPYRNVWALPGLRMFKNESIENVLARIAQSELGLEIDPTQRRFLGQYVGRFRTEHQRQDLSTGYLVRADPSSALRLNTAHYSSVKVVKSIPSPIGAMYRFYLERYFDLQNGAHG